MAFLKQVNAVTGTNFRALPQRRTASLVVVLGMAGVVAVLISLLSMADGLTRTLAQTGRADRALITSRGANSEIGSMLSRDIARQIMDAAQVQRNAAGESLGSAEIIASVFAPLRNRDALGNINIRGVSPEARELRSEMVLAEGRWFRTGVRELVVGRAAQLRFRGLGVGERVRFGDDEWLVVGAFATGGDVRESELQADAETVMSAYRLPVYNSLTVKLTDPAALESFRGTLAANPALAVDVRPEREYYEQQSGGFATLLARVAEVVGTIMAIGAVFAALNTMYSSVIGRTSEIATFRALGYGPSSVVLSVLLESLALCLAGALLGSAVAWLAFDGNTTSSISGTNLAQIVFELRIDGPLVATGIAWACAVAIVGGIFPAIRAARMAIATGLQAS